MVGTPGVRKKVKNKTKYCKITRREDEPSCGGRRRRQGYFVVDSLSCEQDLEIKCGPKKIN